MSETPSRQPANAPAAKSRSPVERLIVWGLIILLGVACLNEYLSKNGHEAALKKLQDKVSAVDKASTNLEVTEVDVKDAVGGKSPSRVELAADGKPLPHGARRMEVYSWFTLNPMNKRDIYVFLSGKGKDSKDLANVLGFDTTLPEAITDGPPAQPGPEMTGPPMGGGPPGMMGPGGRRGGPPADKPADADKADAKATDTDKPAADNAAEDKKTDEKTEEKTE